MMKASYFFVVVISSFILACASSTCTADDVPNQNEIAEPIDQARLNDKVDRLELKRREDAAAALAKAQAERKQLEERLAEARVLALSVLDLEKEGLVPRPERISAVMKRFQTERTNMVNRIIRFRHESRSSIASGAALNYLLDQVGALAHDHTFYRNLKERQGKNEEQGDKQLEQMLLKGLSAEMQVSPNETAHIRYTQGLKGYKLSGRLNGGPLDFEWPSALREEKFLAERDAVVDAAGKAIAELEKGEPVSAGTTEDLLYAVRKLRSRIRKEIQSRLKFGYPAVVRYYAAERHAKMLVAGAYRLAEAQSLADVQLAERFQKGTIEELLAYMYRNNLRFAASDPNGEAAYAHIFDMMVKYYIDAGAMKLAIEEDRARVAQLKGDEKRFQEIALGERMDNRQKFQLGMKAAEAVIEGFKASQESAKADQYRSLTGR